MHRTQRQIVALTAATACLLQAWLGATHVHPHTHDLSADASRSATCRVHAHEHAHADHDHASQAPAQQSDDEHDSNDCQICRLLAQQPLPYVATVELADVASLPDAAHFSIDVPTLPWARRFQSRAPPRPTV
jgi:hypothetical protein